MANVAARKRASDPAAALLLPKRLIVEVTAKCNYRCPFCYCVWHECPELAEPEPTTDGWKPILRHCAGSGVNDLLFSGGEAMLRPDLRELLEYTRILLPAARLGVFTNCSLMSEDYLAFFNDLKIDVSTSLPGLSTYGKMTGTRRSFRRTLAWIARAAELNWPLAVSLTATAANRDEFADMFAAAALSGARTIQIGAMMPEGRGRRHLNLTLTHYEWEEVKKQIRELPDGGVPYAFCDEMLCECREQPETLLKNFGNPARKPCAAGTDFGVVGPAGKFRNCLHTIHSRDLF